MAETPTTTLDYALSYLRRGWSVFPLLPKSKKPACSWTKYQFERMSEESARLCWPARGEYGIAIVTGAISDLVIVDVDPRNGGDCRAVWARLGAASSSGYCGVETGGGGVHYYCQHPGGTVPCGKTIMPGVDRKGDGGYVVAPPSIHPDGGTYRWLYQRTVLPLPAWVLDAPAPTGNGVSSDEPGEPWVAKTLADPQGCMPGSQEETLARLAWWAAKHMPRDIAIVVLSEWCARLPLGRLYEPWTLENVTEKLDRALEKRALEPGRAGAVIDDEPELPGDDGCERVSEMDFPEQPWIVQDFAAPGAFTEVIGKVKKGKSTLTYQLANAVRLGLPFLGRATQASGVVILTEQTGTSLKKTLERAGLLGAPNVYVMRKLAIQQLGWEKAVARATKRCEREGARLLIVDTLSRLAGLGGDSENKSGAVSVLDPFTRAKELGVACVFVRHARKGSLGEHDDIADAARGTSAITGDMDIVVRLLPIQDDLRRLEWESRITDDPEDVYLEYQDGVYVVVERPPSKHEEDEAARLAELRAALADGCTEHKALMARLGWSKNTVTKYRQMAERMTHGPGVGPVED